MVVTMMQPYLVAAVCKSFLFLAFITGEIGAFWKNFLFIYVNWINMMNYLDVLLLFFCWN